MNKRITLILLGIFLVLTPCFADSIGMSFRVTVKDYVPPTYTDFESNTTTINQKGDEIKFSASNFKANDGANHFGFGLVDCRFCW